MPIKVAIVGLFPTVFSTRCKAVCDPAGVAGLRTLEAQLSEYPEVVRAGVKAVTDAVSELIRFFPDLQVELVHAMSLKGLALSVRHRLRSGTYAVFAGRAFALPHQLEELIESVEGALANRT
ncbi:MAG: hypothetical protein QXO17_01260 [Nitrososphaerota archaeon]|nr:hypothetical protein [Candidatus Calditenuis fumarioli]